MSYNNVRNETVWCLDGGQLVDVSSPSISYVAVPFQGVMIDAWSCASAAVTGSTTTITIRKKSGSNVAVDLGTITIASTSGRNKQATFTASESDRTFTAGDTLILDSDGNSSTTSIVNFVASFKGN